VRGSCPNIFIHHDPRPCMAASFETVFSLSPTAPALILNQLPSSCLRKGCVAYQIRPSSCYIGVLGIGHWGIEDVWGVELASEDSKPEAVAKLLLSRFSLESTGQREKTESPMRTARAIGT